MWIFDLLLHKYPRACGLLMILTGIGICIYLGVVTRDGRSLGDSNVFSLPFLFVFGIAAVLEPRLVTAFNRRGPRVGWGFKLASIGLTVVCCLIGYYLETTVFKGATPQGAGL